MPKNDPSAMVAGGTAPPTSGPKPRWWFRTPVLAAIIFAAIVLNDAHVIFYSYQYETNDVAANSMQVLGAKHFHNVLGHYCRFGFYHPGPAFFYTYALGEALFYDATHLVPTPFNAQFIALDALSAFFFAAALTVVARRLGRSLSRWFLGLALLLAAWHFGSVGRFYEYIPGGLFCIWPNCVLVLPFLCFLVAAASVASGAGRDLPLMTLAGCFLVHGHVGFPLFVVPIALLAYGGLVCHSRVFGPLRLTWAWQTFPRQHWFSGALVALFLVPIVIDVATNHPSNIPLILDHMQSNSEERKEVIRSLLYFLHFGAYTAYPNSNFIPALDAFDAPGTALFFRTHWRAYGLWLLVVLVPLTILRKRTPQVLDGNARTSDEARHSGQGTVRAFLRGMYLILSAATLLTVVWGCIQYGPLYYHNAFFNFAIYYGFLIILAVVAARWIEDFLSAHHLAPSPFRIGKWRNWFATCGPITIVFLAITVLAREGRRFRSPLMDQAQQQMFAASMEQALKDKPALPKLLIFDGNAWAEAAGVGVFLERAGCRWNVLSYSRQIPLIFGRARAIPDMPPETPAGLSIWRVLPREAALPLENDHRFNVIHLTNKVSLAIQSTPANETPLDK